VVRHVPNILSLLRLGLSPVFVGLLLLPGFRTRLLALVLFVVAALTDWFDGQIARAYRARTRLGQFLDPLADKVLTISAFLCLPLLYPSHFPWPAIALIILRDIWITGLRIWAERQHRPIPTSELARWKTALQMLFLVYALLWLTLYAHPDWQPTARFWLEHAFTSAWLWTLVGLSVWTAVDYSRMWFR
jgi:CDP-diacylglycerol--glycerol-3-phosphate 3-phosphatidyltransferase